MKRERAPPASEEDAGNEGVKLIWWFASVRTGAESTLGRRPSRSSSSADEALRRAMFQTERDDIARAVELVRATHSEAREGQQPSLVEPGRSGANRKSELALLCS